MLYYTSILIINRIKKHDIILYKHFHRELNTIKFFNVRIFILLRT